jgi:hypothetical protein
MCKHEGFYSCIGRYDRRAGRLVYFMVCDECHQTLNSVLEQPYEPHFVNSTTAPPATRADAVPAH